MSAYVIQDARIKHVGDISASRKQGAQLRGGEGRHMGIQCMHPCIRFEGAQSRNIAVELLPCSACDRNLGKPEHTPGTMPMWQRMQRVGPKDEHEARRGRPGTAQFLKRVNRVRDARPLNLHCTQRAGGLSFEHARKHRKPMMGARHLAVALERGTTGRDVENPVETQLPPGSTGKLKMAEMRRVERSAHHAQCRIRVPGKRHVRRHP